MISKFFCNEEIFKAQIGPNNMVMCGVLQPLQTMTTITICVTTFSIVTMSHLNSHTRHGRVNIIFYGGYNT